jgi:hypothetical protein
VPTVYQARATQTATLSTVHTLIDSTDNRWFSGYIDLTNMAVGDVTKIIVSVKINSTLIQWFSKIFYGVQTNKLLFLPTLPSTLEYKVTLQQTAGIGRAYDHVWYQP